MSNKQRVASSRPALTRADLEESAMADSENTTTETRVRASELVEQLRAAGVDNNLTIKVFECIETNQAEAIAKAARLFYNFSDEEGPITPGEFSDQLNNMSRRLWGLEAAVCYIASDYLDKGAQTGVRQLVEDAAREMERLAEAFEAERWIARHDEAQS